MTCSVELPMMLWLYGVIFVRLRMIIVGEGLRVEPVA